MTTLKERIEKMKERDSSLNPSWIKRSEVLTELDKTIEEIEKMEDAIDKYNGEHGDINGLCVSCKSTKYNSKEGIVHSELCAITVLRSVLAKLREAKG